MLLEEVSIASDPRNNSPLTWISLSHFFIIAFLISHSQLLRAAQEGSQAPHGCSAFSQRMYPQPPAQAIFPYSSSRCIGMSHGYLIVLSIPDSKKPWHRTHCLLESPDARLASETLNFNFQD